MILDEKYLQATELLFKNIPLNNIINSCFKINSNSMFAKYDGINKNLFVHKFVSMYKEFTIDEVEAYYNFYFFDRNSREIFKDKKCGVFENINNISNEMLVDINANPKVKFENLFRWNLVTRKIGEELFTTSYYAMEDVKFNRNRTNFFWNPIITTDNNRLEDIFDKKLAENHFHLKGSSYVLICNWISLMNDIVGRKKDFNYMGVEKILLSKEVYINSQDVMLPLYHIVKIAYVIRLYLFLKYCQDDFDDENFMKFDSNTFLDEYALNECIQKLKVNIDFMRVRSKTKLFGRNRNEAIDYAILDSKYTYEDSEMAIYFGERFFMYEIYKKLYKNELSEVDKNLFYIYNSAKTKFQSELVQHKDILGFKNFTLFQDRKSIFIKSNSIIEKCLIRLAINTNIKSQNLETLEARIAPASNKNGFVREIKKLDNYCEDEFTYETAILKGDEKKEQSKRHFYAIHLIKRPDKKDKYSHWRRTPKNAKIRQEAKRTVLALMKIRNNSRITARERIKGIDACNFEIGTRPEVFAQMYRVLSAYSIDSEVSIKTTKKSPLTKLGKTYHVGEDFSDLLDGMRSVDEAIYYLELKNGDRIAHGLAVGYDVKKWYKSKKNTVTLTKQDLLDNLIWLLEKTVIYNIDTSVKFNRILEEKIKELLNEIYFDFYASYNNVNESDICVYTKSVKLRGDDPFCYVNDSIDTSKSCLSFWNSHQLKAGEELELIRKNKDACALYSNYHFNTKSVNKGAEFDVFIYNDEVISVIDEVQNMLKKEMTRLRVCIECNPTSNYYIGNVDRYEEHPIIKWNNKNLTNDIKELEKSPNINVSINTDDQGVFSTSLQSEYSLLALALIKAQDENGNKKYKEESVYAWLEYIRQNGINQTFK